MQKNISIAIIGGGPGGLTLARVLATRGIATTVFELDGHELSRPQGGSLDLHAESGLFALQQAGLEKEFQAVARYEDQEDRVYDMSGTLLASNTGSVDHNRPEID